MARTNILANQIARTAEREFKAKEDLREIVNAAKRRLLKLRQKNRILLGEMMDREGFLDLPTEELAAGLELLKVIRSLDLLTKRAEAERRLREPSGRSTGRKDDMAVAESVAQLASAAE